MLSKEDKKLVEQRKVKMASFRECIYSLEQNEREKFAQKVGTTWRFLQNIATGWKPVTAAMAIKIEKATDRLFICEELAPEHDWEFIRHGWLDVYPA